METTVRDVGCEIRAEGDTLADCSVEHVRELLARQGYVLFSGFEPSLADFELFTSRFGTCAETRHVHYPESGSGLGFHSEDAYNPYRPDALWFLCVYEGSDGGVPTGAVDGAELLTAMPEEWREYACTHALRFDRIWDAPVWQQAAQVPGRAELAAELDAIPDLDHAFLADGSLRIGYEVPLIATTPSGRQAFSNSLLQAVTDSAFYGTSIVGGSSIPTELLSVAEKLALELERTVGWATGDIAVIDNLRMMHRRGTYHQKDRDLRPRHCEDLFGSVMPAADTELQAWTKKLIQGDIALPDRVGLPDGIEQRTGDAGRISA